MSKNLEIYTKKYKIVNENARKQSSNKSHTKINKNGKQ